MFRHIRHKKPRRKKKGTKNLRQLGDFTPKINLKKES